MSLRCVREGIVVAGGTLITCPDLDPDRVCDKSIRWRSPERLHGIRVPVVATEALSCTGIGRAPDDGQPLRRRHGSNTGRMQLQAPPPLSSVWHVLGQSCHRDDVLLVLLALMLVLLVPSLLLLLMCLHVLFFIYTCMGSHAALGDFIMKCVYCC